MSEGGRGGGRGGTFGGGDGGGVGGGGVDAAVQQAVGYVLCVRGVTVGGAVVFGVVCECGRVVWGRLWRGVGKVLWRAIWRLFVR